MRIKPAACIAGVALLLVVPRALAHHAFSAEFDATKPIKVTGAVTKVEWKNPHAYFFIDVPDEAGQVVNWAFEMGSPNGLMRAGWNRNTLRIGDVISVEGSPAKDGTHIGNARVVILTTSGQRLFAASSQTNP